MYLTGGRGLLSSSDEVGVGPLQGLTAKQCQVLDLLIQHKTSKEISRMLGISPHTVDQRIMLARAKLQVGTRGEVAQAYRQLLTGQGKTSAADICDQSVYGFPYVATDAETSHVVVREAADGSSSDTFPAAIVNVRSQAKSIAQALPADANAGYYHVLPEAFDGPGGTLLRLGAIAMITVFLTLVILGGMAMYVQLSHMLDG